jgi:hypothetical protein
MVEDIGPETLRERDPKKLIPPLHGALIKNEQDVHLFERLAFMARREGRWPPPRLRLLPDERCRQPKSALADFGQHKLAELG